VVFLLSKGAFGLVSGLLDIVVGRKRIGYFRQGDCVEKSVESIDEDLFLLDHVFERRDEELLGVCESGGLVLIEVLPIFIEGDLLLQTVGELDEVSELIPQLPNLLVVPIDASVLVASHHLAHSVVDQLHLGLHIFLRILTFANVPTHLRSAALWSSLGTTLLLSEPGNDLGGVVGGVVGSGMGVDECPHVLIA
jgi:hypothetical protein